MELTFGEEYESYRDEIRSFLADQWPAERRGRSREDHIAFRKLATERGYLNRAFPRRFGGSEQPSDPAKAQIISEEFGRARAPQESGIGVVMLAPTLLERGEEWQKEKFIPPTLSGEILWCQGYSEPGAGSDLASLRTAGILDGDEWIVNGQKIWTTAGHVADFMFTLVRTEKDVPAKQGISYLLLDMHQPGVEVRPLKQITGSAEFNEVFLTDARTPKNWIVGRRGEGWSVANTTLKHERGGVGGTAGIDAQFGSLVKLVQRASLDGHPAMADPGIRDRLVQIQARLEAHRYCSYFQLSRSLKGESSGRVSFMNKLNVTNLGQRMADLALDVLQDSSLLDPVGGTEGERPGDERWMNQYLGSLALAIAGGTSNIQRNIIAERGLGLPRDAQVAESS
jgi:alkylation response protein AidB-like acyl-CoA dehydrogenase